MMKTIARFAKPEPAYVAKGLLEAANIEVFLDDSRFPDRGEIVLQVLDEEETQARHLLAEKRELLQSLQPSTTPEDTDEPAPESSPTPWPWLFIQGGGLFLVGYLLIAILMIALGGRLPMNLFIFVLVFFLGGLSLLVALGNRTKPSPKDD
ncbi:MAG: DUF2007 domain-containing protein [Opitutales bacterium]|nr:DUF2007 domain-containing protein [Opitutales bacterium]